jgi:hypothetical protein
MMARLLVETPPGYRPEREYITKLFFEEFLGLEWDLKEAERRDVRLAVQGLPGEILLPDQLFCIPLSEWLRSSSLPKTPLPFWDTRQLGFEVHTIENLVPVIYGDSNFHIEVKEDLIRLPIDILGSAFFMLTRYEEILLSDRDEYDRFPAKASLAFQEGFLERPIVDEYVEILWACMKRLWPGLERNQRSYQIFLSHDVDSPISAVNKSWRLVLHYAAGDIVKRHDVQLAIRRIVAKCLGSYDVDPFNTFNFIMDLSERYGLKSAFYFKAGSTNSRLNEEYSLEMPFVRTLMLQVHERGHEIGLHPSLGAHKDVRRLRTEFELLLDTAERLNIKQERWGARQHYLLWKNPGTWQNWEDVGLDYDATLSFADHVGFRCGTCNEIPVFDLMARRTLHLRERPLIAMDSTLFHYMALRPAQVLGCIERLSNVIRSFGGTFSLLWHNTSVAQPWQKQFYLEVLEVLSK